ncbi:uncharacterized protein N7479_008293 [Penicillium vulpinum]|uniref:SMP-30/Gluconolactonase/LRE-like region domain-containing protein n=1 Tax=Penicillium vulpinum TaxID=29845 RepID=A0A1V6RJH6_9EURO|nr:uncharacterized protein N7479_008293 [Penicillium vulpinum]KAJ5961143.1 hypothetical protein N7479_008293 [Penicillium vulpinum]OQE01604.1 hypothetical protein PENVUL_c042G00612 [Penicillium vulpinum]
MILPNTFFVAVFYFAILTAQSSPISAIYEFPPSISLENLAIGPSINSILVTSDNTPSVYQINIPTHPSSKVAALPIYTFPNATGLLGIVKYALNTYAIVVGNFSIADFGQNTSFSIWSITFPDDGSSQESGAAVKAHKITDIAQARMLNGMTTLNEDPPTVLIADSLAGCVYRLHASTGKLEVVLEDETMKPGGAPEEPVSLRSVALNGIRKVTTMNDTYLYYSNSNKSTINRVLIDPLSGYARGPYTTLTTTRELFSPDDLIYDYETGDVYFAGHMDNVIVRVSPNREGEETVVGNVTAPSSLVFGEGKKSRILYGTTASETSDGIKKAGGRLVTVRIDDL